MAAVLTGTPTAVTWASGANPAGQSITIPSDATAVYMFWAFFLDSGTPGIASATLNSVAPAEQVNAVGDATNDYSAVGVCAWYNPSTGSQTLDVAWDGAPTEGPTCIVAYVKGGNTTAWRDADFDQQAGITDATVTLTTVSGDLVLKFDARYSVVPALSGGWTNAQTTTNVDEGARLSYISASGTTVVCDSEDENYSALVAISIPEGAGGSSIAHTRLSLLGVG